MNWIAILFAVELGILPIGNLRLYEPVYSYEPAANYYVDLAARVVLWDSLYFGGAAKTYFCDVPDTYMFNPHAVNFLVEAGLRHKGFTIGWRHYCIHPFMPMFPDTVKQIWDGGYEEAFIRFEAKIGGKH